MDQETYLECKDTHFKTNLTLWRCGKEMVFLVSGAKKIKFPCGKQFNSDPTSRHIQFQVNYKSKCEKPSIQLLARRQYLFNQA